MDDCVTGSVAHIDDRHDSRDHFFMKKNVAVNDNNDNDDCDESSYKTKSLLCLKIDDDVLNSLICENAIYPSDTMIKEYFCSMFKASVICIISFTVRENACS